MPWVSPIYDRTHADVLFAAEHGSSPLPLKGARNHTDLQRITGNAHYLRDYFVLLGFAVPSMTCKTAWSLGEVPAYAEIAKIRADLISLKAVVPAIQSAAVPSLPYNDYMKINDVERILFDIERVLAGVEKSIIRCGEIFSGEW